MRPRNLDLVCLLIKGVTKALHHAFKASCARRGQPMTTVIKKLMRKYVEESNKLNSEWLRDL